MELRRVACYTVYIGVDSKRVFDRCNDSRRNYCNGFEPITFNLPGNREDMPFGWEGGQYCAKYCHKNRTPFTCTQGIWCDTFLCRQNEVNGV